MGVISDRTYSVLRVRLSTERENLYGSIWQCVFCVVRSVGRELGKENNGGGGWVSGGGGKEVE